MKRKIIYIIILLIIGYSCKKENHEINDTKQYHLNNHSDYEYAFNLFKNLKIKESKNIVISPISTTMTLGMLYQGASDKVKQQLKSESIWNNENLEKINNELNSLKNGVDISIENKFYYDNKLAIKNSFINQSKQLFKADIIAIKPNATSKVNQNKSIEKSGVRLVNKTSFVGKWKNKFTLSSEKKTFTSQTGKGIEVEMMKKNTDIQYLSSDEFDMFEIPYKNERIVMTIVMPKSIENLPKIVKEMNCNRWIAYKEKMEIKRNAQISIPKFHCQYTLNVKDAFANPKLQRLFKNNTSSFPYITDETIMLNDVMQNSEIRIDESGTDARVTTFIAKSFTSLVNDNPVNIVVNKPFFFTIEDTKTNTFLFLGTITQP